MHAKVKGAPCMKWLSWGHEYSGFVRHHDIIDRPRPMRIVLGSFTFIPIIATAMREPFVVITIAIIASLAFGPNALCSDTELPLQRHGDSQKFLQGSKAEPTSTSFKNVVQIPLQRNFIQYNGRFYLAQVNVGSPKQSLDLIVDTGSTDAWVYGVDYCADQSSNNHFQCCTSARKSPFSSEHPQSPNEIS